MKAVIPLWGFLPDLFIVLRSPFTTKFTKNPQSSLRIKKASAGVLLCVHSAFFVFFVVVSLLFTTSAFSQPTHFARLSVSSKSVLTGQAFRVKISVYTPTWFTKAPNFGEYQVQNSFTLRTDRPLSLYESINGTRYTTLNYEYIIFPIKPGLLELPALEVIFESPKEGDYKGIPIQVTTNKASITINPIPNKPDSLALFVAQNVRLTETWNRPLTELKTGDVLERTIRISATGTLANMIPSTQHDSLPWTSRYTATPQLSQSFSDKAVNSTRLEKHTYLIEKEGKVTLPELTISYYNLHTKKWITRNIRAKHLNIADNPNLYALKSLQDSLMAGETPSEKTGSEQNFSFLGLSLKQAILVFATVLALIVLSFWVGGQIVRRYRKHRSEYLESEIYCFKQLKQHIIAKNLKRINLAMYVWIEKLQGSGKLSSMEMLADRTNNPELIKNVDELQGQLFASSESSIKPNLELNDLLRNLKLSRNNYLQKQNTKTNQQLNPN